MATTRLMSFADFERLDGGPEHLELLKGELVRRPPPYADQMEIVERLFELLKSGAHGIGKVHMEMGYLLPTEPPSWLRPDVSLTHPQQARDRFYLGAPLIAFEIVSEHDKAPDLDAKVTEYLLNGSHEVWLIYPGTRHAVVFGPAGATRTESAAIRTDLLPGLDIPLDSILL